MQKMQKEESFRISMSQQKIHHNNTNNEEESEQCESYVIDNIFNVFSLSEKGTFKNVSIDGYQGMKMYGISILQPMPHAISGKSSADIHYENQQKF